MLSVHAQQLLFQFHLWNLRNLRIVFAVIRLSGSDEQTSIRDFGV